VILFDPASFLNPQGQNALLKALEDAPPSNTFLLVVASPSLLLPTVRSRCRRVRLRALEREETLAVLRSRLPDMDPEEAELRAAFAPHSPGRAMDLDPALLEETRTALQAWMEDRDPRPLLRWAEERDKQRESGLEAALNLLADALEGMPHSQSGRLRETLEEVREILPFHPQLRPLLDSILFAPED